MPPRLLVQLAARRAPHGRRERAGDYAIAQLEADTEANAAAASRNAGASASLGKLAGTLLTGDLSSGILGGIFK